MANGSITSVNEYFDQVYVLNLAHRLDRKLGMIKKLSQLRIQATFVEAVNGHWAPHKQAYQAYVSKPIGSPGTHPYEVKFQKKMIDSPGAWGYLKTMRGILLDALRHNHERILCLDDDVIFHKDFLSKFAEFTRQVPADWKLCYLGASQYSWDIPYALRYKDSQKLNFDPTEAFYYPIHTDGSFAVGIHRSVFELLLFEINKMNCPFDSGPLHSISNRYPDQCFVANPNIIIADVTDSDIREDAKMEETDSILQWPLEEFSLDMQYDLVSVIMPVHNGEKTIGKAIQSILDQTYRHIELIIVDDGSQDRTAEEIQKWVQKDPRIRFVSLAENVGVGLARNEGIKHSKGKFILFQDADDISLKDRLYKQLIPFYEKNLLFCLGRYYRSRCKIEELEGLDETNMMALVESRRIKKADGSFDYEDQAILAFATALFRREVFETFGLYLDLKFGEDLELFERILFHTIQKTFITGDIFGPYEFLSQCDNIPTVYHRVEEVLMVGVEVNAQNLTMIFKDKRAEQLSIQKKYRATLVNGAASYEKLPAISEHVESQSNLFQSLYLQGESFRNGFAYFSGSSSNERDSDMNFSLGREYTLEELNSSLLKELAAMKNSWSWRITYPIRKIAGLFIRESI